MYLNELVEKIEFGTKILEQHYLNGKQVNADSIRVISPSNITADGIGGEYRCFKRDTFKKIYGDGLDNLLLRRNDLLFDILSKKLMLWRQDMQEDFMPDENFAFIRPASGYLIKFAENDLGRAFLVQELTAAFNSRETDKTAQIGKINIPDDLSNIKEKLNEGIRPDKRKVDINSINIQQGLMTLDRVLKRIIHGEININSAAYFQRKIGLWKEDAKCRLIEALIVRQPIPAFYFDGTDDSQWLIVDGLQRISTIKAFVLDKTLKLDKKHLFYLDEDVYHNKGFDELPRSAQRNIEEYQIITYTILDPTPKDVKYKIFRSINTAALILENQEIRHALNQGRPAKYVEELSEMPIFKTVCPLSLAKKDRMEDRELALRYLAFRVSGYLDYRPTITDFLDTAMTKLFMVPEKVFENLSRQFGEALFTMHKVFGEQAFKRGMVGQKSESFTNILFEIWTYALSMLPDEQHERLRGPDKKRFQEAVYELGKNQVFERSIDADYAYSIESVEIRFSTAEKTIKSIIDDRKHRNPKL